MSVVDAIMCGFSRGMGKRREEKGASPHTPKRSEIVPATLFKATEPATPIRKQKMTSMGKLSANAVPMFKMA
jgi:hypothetical protein